MLAGMHPPITSNGEINQIGMGIKHAQNTIKKHTPYITHIF